MPRNNPALTDFEKKMAILKLLYAYIDPSDGPRAYQLENNMPNKVDFTNHLNTLVSLGLIKEMNHERFKVRFYNITEEGRALVDAFDQWQQDPKKKTMASWMFRLTQTNEGKFTFPKSEESE